MHRILKTLLWLGWLLGAAGAVAQQDDEFLGPDEAFRLSVESVGAESVRLRWEVAEDYYLYGGKFGFEAEGPVALGAPERRRGKTKQDEFFGEVEVLRQRIDVELPLIRDSAAARKAQTLILKAKSQGCADAGLCYPPQRKTLELELPAAQAAAGANALETLSAIGAELGPEGEPELLSAEDAFTFEAFLAEGPAIELAWRVAEGTYLYQDQIELQVLAPAGVRLGEYALPPAKIKQDAVRPDGTFGDLAVYEAGDFGFRVPLTGQAAAGAEIQFQTRFQGCAEIGVCYPPRQDTRTFTLKTALDSGDAAAAVSRPIAESAPAAEAPPVSEQDRIAASLMGGNMWVTVATFFVAGLLLSLTPCVFPMIPILSGIIAGQGRDLTTSKAFTLSLVYVVAMAVTYTVAGVLAGVFGQNLQAAFQDPWILGVFAAVFVALAFSMFGFYELQLPSSLQSRLAEISNRQQGGTLAGVAIMGFLSALIVGPCVAPPLAGALIYIGQTGDAVLGGMALFALSMGMGAPLLVIGTLGGKYLPRAGAWMDAVKAVFGVGLLAVAIVLLERIIPPAAAMLLWGALLICSAVYMGALRDLPVEAGGWVRLWKGLGVVLLIYGALMLVGVAAGGKDTVQPLRGLGFGGGAAGQAGHIEFKRIKSLADLQREVAAASAAGRPVMLDFYADWCVSCKEMERYTFSDPQVIAATQGFEILQADVTDNDATDQALMAHFGIPGPPAILFYGPQGEERRNYRVVGFMAADEFAAHASKAVQ